MGDQAVKNAADPKQVRGAERKDRRRERERREAIVSVISTPLGRRMLWDLLETVGTFRSVMDPPELAHYNAGRQDVGHRLMAELAEIDGPAYDLMFKEARQRASRDAVDYAANTAATTGEDS